MLASSHSPAPAAVLCFGASDPTAAGGLQGDLLCLAALGVYPLSVMTGLMVQDTSRTEAFSAIDGEWVADQARALLEDVPVSAFKLGQFVSVDNVAEVADVLADYPDQPVVYSPDLSACGNDAEAEEEMAEAICELILPMSTLVICSRDDALRLALGGVDDESGEEDGSAEDAEDAGEPGDVDCARQLLAYGAEHVLIGGAHAQSPQIINTLFGQQGVLRTDSWERLPGSYLGANDLLAAAAAAFLARGLPLDEAVREAQAYAWQCLAQGWRLGMGRIVPNHFCSARPA